MSKDKMEYKHRMKEALLFNVLVGIIARIIIIIARSPHCNDKASWLLQHNNMLFVALAHSRLVSRLHLATIILIASVVRVCRPRVSTMRKGNEHRVHHKDLRALCAAWY